MSWREVISVDIDFSLIKKAYKKLKSSVFYDKTQLILRDKIVEFESCSDNSGENIDEKLKKLFDDIIYPDCRERLKSEILDSIGYHSFPKKLKSSELSIITNTVSNKTEIEETQYFIDMDVRGHIIGVLWLLLIGWRLDKGVYEHSYGNRIRKKLINDFSKNVTFSPNLFEPYYVLYESWRDTALSCARKSLDKSQDVMILTMDFSRFYYSLDMTRDSFKCFFELIEENIQSEPLYKELHFFIYEIIERYSEKLGKLFDGRKVLPIGFLPSNVLANCYLSKFDKAVIDDLNPMYYGRYVDDILIVEKIEKNSRIYKEAMDQRLNEENAIKYFFGRCINWDKHDLRQEKDQKEVEHIDQQRRPILTCHKDKDNNNIYKVDRYYYIDEKSKTEIKVKNQKVKIFHFSSAESDALLNCFIEHLRKNKSEFRYMPECDAVFEEDNYNEIYCLKGKDGVRKLGDAEGVSIDKYALSKFLGKYMRISGLVDDSRAESKFEKDIAKIFNSHTIVENYTTWEKIIQVFVINNRFSAVYNFVTKIIEAIKNLNFSGDANIKDDSVKDVSAKDDFDKDSDHVRNMRSSMLLFLRGSLARATSLNWCENSKNCIEKIYRCVKDTFSSTEEEEAIIKEECEVINSFCNDTMTELRKNYCKTRMNDKYIIPIMIDALLNTSEDLFDDSKGINLASFRDILRNIDPEKQLSDDDYYYYYPYIVKMHDLSMYTIVKKMLNEECNKSLKEDLENNQRYYLKLNYKYDKDKEKANDQETDYMANIAKDFENEIQIEELDLLSGDCKKYAVKVGSGRKDRLKIAVANTRIHEDNFQKIVRDEPNRTYRRYQELSLLLNKAISEGADMLILPEAFLPFEWIPTLARTCEKNQLAVVTGVEYLKIGHSGKIYNLTAVILPYKDKHEYESSYIGFHLKRHYAPVEIKNIEGYRLKPVAGDHYELYCWNDCWFPVYCCYELASIKDRSLFQSYADMLIAVEWNRDTNYYSNIVESLARDLHCYCVQVNYCNYGDSRITQPTKTEIMDIVKVKGGKNSTIIIGEIDIKRLREFQFMGVSIQDINREFKFTPPEFDTDIIYKKMKHTLWEELKNKNNEKEKNSS